jgi:hypothetical protein
MGNVNMGNGFSFMMNASVTSDSKRAQKRSGEAEPRRQV